MFQRLCKLPKSNSFFLLGARGTGKSHLLQETFKRSSAFWVDLLDPDQEMEYSLNPKLVLERWEAQNQKPNWIIIDEVQKNPRLLDLAHLGIEKHNIHFGLTGSSARKLKRGASNMLAGRAFVFHLHPLTFVELGERFRLEEVLRWGSLPKIYSLESDSDIKKFLKSYTLTYLKEEIQVEQIVRRIEPFRRFLEVAAQANGEILNFSRLAREAGVEPKSVERYFEILQDTLLGFFLNAYHTSVRKQQTLKPKFYFFDLGVCKAAQGLLDVPLRPKTFAYGKAFEHFVILECLRLNDYLEKDFQFSYLRTKDGAEIDLIIERPNKGPILVKIKSGDFVDPVDLLHLKKLGQEFKNPDLIVLSQEKASRIHEKIKILPWQEGLKNIFDIRI